MRIKRLRKYKLNIYDKRIFFLGSQDRTTEYYTTFYNNKYENITVAPVFSNVTSHSSKFDDFETGKEEGKGDDEKIWGEENAYIKVLAKRDGGRGSGFMVLLKLNRKTLKYSGNKKKD